MDAKINIQLTTEAGLSAILETFIIGGRIIVMENKPQTFLKNYNYYLPKYLIAKYPPKKRGFSNLLVYYTQTGEQVFTKYYNLYKFVPPKTLVVRNVSKVFKARLFVDAVFTDGEIKSNVETLVLSAKGKKLSESLEVKGSRIKVAALLRFPARKLSKVAFFKKGDWKIYPDLNSKYKRERILYFQNTKYSSQRLISEFIKFLDKNAKVPIPPYLERQATKIDEKRYQSVFAREVGSVAAPTASLNFTKSLATKLLKNNVGFANVVLHVGLGTFLPVSNENIEKNRLHSEAIYINRENLEKIYLQKLNDNPVLAIGTTVVRTLETLALDYNLNLPDLELPEEYFKHTQLFIHPPFEFKVVDMLLTNFHLPQSSLIMLVDAFLQYKQAKHSWKELYQEAIKRKFRFYSYGDSMLII